MLLVNLAEVAMDSLEVAKTSFYGSLIAAP